MKKIRPRTLHLSYRTSFEGDLLMSFSGLIAYG